MEPCLGSWARSVDQVVSGECAVITGEQRCQVLNESLNHCSSAHKICVGSIAIQGESQGCSVVVSGCEAVDKAAQIVSDQLVTVEPGCAIRDSLS